MRRALAAAALGLLLAGCGDDAPPARCKGAVPRFATPDHVREALTEVAGDQVQVLSLGADGARVTPGTGVRVSAVDPEAPQRLIRAADVRDPTDVARVTLTGFGGRLVWGVSYRDGDLVTGDRHGTPTAPAGCQL